MISDFCLSAEAYDLNDPSVRKFIRASGISEISMNPSMFMKKDDTRESTALLRKTIEADGLFSTTCHPPFGSFNQRFSTLRQDPEGLKKDIGWMKEFIIRCGILGVKAIPLHTGGAMLPRARKWETDSARRYVEALLPTAEESGVIIAVENTNHATPIGFYPGMSGDPEMNTNIWEFDDTGKILEFVHGFRSDFVKVCYDTGHSHLLGRMLTDLEAFYDDIVLFHIHDNDGAGNDAHIQPGYGNTDWKTLMRRIYEMPERPTVLVEAPPYFGDVSLMVSELEALKEGRVKVKAGGFLEKDEEKGRLVLLDSKED